MRMVDFLGPDPVSDLGYYNFPPGELGLCPPGDGAGDWVPIMRRTVWYQ